VSKNEIKLMYVCMYVCNVCIFITAEYAGSHKTIEYKCVKLKWTQKATKFLSGDEQQN